MWLWAICWIGVIAGFLFVVIFYINEFLSTILGLNKNSIQMDNFGPQTHRRTHRGLFVGLVWLQAFFLYVIAGYSLIYRKENPRRNTRNDRRLGTNGYFTYCKNIMGPIWKMALPDSLPRWHLARFGPTMVWMTGADTPPILIVPPTLRLICLSRAYRLD